MAVGERDRRRDDAFRDLQSPRMGTELMAPLLYCLARSVRAQTILEVGAGVTTLQLAAALRDNGADVAAEREALPGKQQLYDPSWSDEQGEGSADGQAVLRWLLADPPLVDPTYLARAWKPRLVSIDSLSSPYSCAPAAWEAVAREGLGHLLDHRRSDFRPELRRLAAEGTTFDLVWFDCGGSDEYRDFLRSGWDLARPEGSLLVLHYTLTVPGHERAITEVLEEWRRGGRAFEVLSLLEPHKLMQNSCTMIRRRDGATPSYPLTRPVSLERTNQ